MENRDYMFLWKLRPQQHFISRNMKGIRRLSISLDEKEYERLALVAEKLGVSLAWVARRGLSRWLDEIERDSQLTVDLKPFSFGDHR